MVLVQIGLEFLVLKGEITVVNFQKVGLTGTISPEFTSLKSWQRSVLDGSLSGNGGKETYTKSGEIVLYHWRHTFDNHWRHTFGNLGSLIEFLPI